VVNPGESLKLTASIDLNNSQYDGYDKVKAFVWGEGITPLCKNLQMRSE